MNGYTKGPWSVNDKRESGWMNNAIYVSGAGGENIARVFNDYGNAEQNARLIAAAHDLLYALDALVSAVELPGHHCEAYQCLPMAHAAIEKAIGD